MPLYDQLLARRADAGRRAQPGRGGRRGATGPPAGLAAVDALPDLDDYHLFHATRADLLARPGGPARPRTPTGTALALTDNEAERAFLAAALRGL